MPDQSLSAGVVVSVAPPSKLAVLVSAPPFRWTAGWTVNVTVPARSGRTRLVSAGVRSRIEQDGRVLADLPEQLQRFSSIFGEESVLAQFPQHVTYDTPATPPTTAQLVIAVRLIDLNGRSEESHAPTRLRKRCAASKVTCRATAPASR
jgi:hypothetical protein